MSQSATDKPLSSSGKRAAAIGANFIVPGFGQFILRRWFSGVVYTVTFLGACVAAVVGTFGFAFAYRSTIEDGVAFEDTHGIAWIVIGMVGAILTVVIWAASILHVFVQTPADPKPEADAADAES